MLIPFKVSRLHPIWLKHVEKHVKQLVAFIIKWTLTDQSSERSRNIPDLRPLRSNVSSDFLLTFRHTKIKKRLETVGVSPPFVDHFPRISPFLFYSSVSLQWFWHPLSTALILALTAPEVEIAGSDKTSGKKSSWELILGSETTSEYFAMGISKYDLKLLKASIYPPFQSVGAFFGSRFAGCPGLPFSYGPMSFTCTSMQINQP